MLQRRKVAERGHLVFEPHHTFVLYFGELHFYLCSKIMRKKKSGGFFLLSVRSSGPGTQDNAQKQ